MVIIYTARDKVRDPRKKSPSESQWLQMPEEVLHQHPVTPCPPQRRPDAFYLECFAHPAGPWFSSASWIALLKGPRKTVAHLSGSMSLVQRKPIQDTSLFSANCLENAS